jgi:SHS2 domain-containing protein
MGAHQPDFELLDHTADLGIKVRGTDVNDLFESAAISMVQVMTSGKPTTESVPMKVSVNGTDLSDLMVRWLGEILYLFEVEKKVVTAVEIISISPSALAATIDTVPLDLDKYEIFCEIKAVTYHQIEVAKKAKYWEAQIIFDL